MMMRRIGGSLAGVAVAVGVIMAIEATGHLVTGAPSNPAQATPAMLLWVLAAWTVGTLVGAWVAVRLSRRGAAAWAPAALVMLGVVLTAVSIPATPWWLTGGGLLLPCLSAALLSRRGAGDQRVAL